MSAITSRRQRHLLPWALAAAAFVGIAIVLLYAALAPGARDANAVEPSPDTQFEFIPPAVDDDLSPTKPR